MSYGYVTDKTKIIKRIFQDHWEAFLREHKDKIPEEMLSSVIDAVSKMLICAQKNRSNQKKSSYTYRCTHCGREDIPKGVVDFFDAIDPGGPKCPISFPM